jgi:hypothetical protein
LVIPLSDAKSLNLNQEKLDLIARLLIVDIIKDKEPKDQVKLLDQAGLTPSEIAKIIHKTPNAVRLLLYAIRHRSPNLKRPKPRRR